ncbi:MAG: hypothetical protein Q9162_001727 [Coniocarpon cinnabarinum]
MALNQVPTKRRKLDNRKPSQDRDDGFDAEFSAQASTWNLEQMYEKRSRKRVDDNKKQRLPIKTATGVVEQIEPDLNKDDASSTSAESLPDDTSITEPSESDHEKPTVSDRDQIISAKEGLAKSASLINESPEEHYALLKTLADVTSSRISTVTKLGLVTQLSVYKDIVPSYRIRAITDEEAKAKVSKDVRKQRAFEQSLVKGYQSYVRELKRLSQLDIQSSKETESLVDVAVGCACNLLEHVPHFNFRDELLSIAVDKVSRRPSSLNFVKCHTALVKLFEADDSGNASHEAVSMLSKMIKTRKYRIHEAVLNLFLHLRLLSEFSQKASATKVDKDTEGQQPLRKRSKKEREHRSKQGEKLAKERKAIEKEMQEADAVVSHEERDRNQAEMLKLVLSTYFRILKDGNPRMIGVVLEGLVKYAHLVNQDFFGDLLEALRELVQQVDDKADSEAEDPDRDEQDSDSYGHRDATRKSLLCVITAFGLLQGQEVAKSATSLGLDLSYFIKHLYQHLIDLSMNLDVETKSTHTKASDPEQTTASAAQLARINVSTTIVLLLRSLRATLVPANARSVPPVRLAAFTKQLMTSSLQLPEKSSTALLGLTNEVLRTHRGKIDALWNTEERRGDGGFNALHGDVEGSNPFATTIWEGELLIKHVCPQVRDGVQTMYETLNKS